MACRAHYAPVLQLETLSNQYLLIIELSLCYNIIGGIDNESSR